MASNMKVKKSSTDKPEKPSPFTPAQIKKFIEEVKVEFLKIVWPDKKMTLGLTGVITSYSIHYTKLYDGHGWRSCRSYCGQGGSCCRVITSYSIHYTKLYDTDP